MTIKYIDRRRTKELGNKQVHRAKGADKPSKEEMLERAHYAAKLVQIDELFIRFPFHYCLFCDMIAAPETLCNLCRFLCTDTYVLICLAGSLFCVYLFLAVKQFLLVFKNHLA